jgi:ATP-dependent Clp protease adapter protein ClpS
VSHLYWILIPAGLILVGLLIELRARRSRREYPFPERARLLHQALRAGVDITIVFWSRSKNRFMTQTLKPVELHGFYLKGIETETGSEIAVKITRIKEITPLQPLSPSTETASEQVSTPDRRRRRRRQKHTFPMYLIVFGATGLVMVLVMKWAPRNRVLRMEFDEDTQKVRVQKDVSIDAAATVPSKPVNPETDLTNLPAAAVKSSTMVTTGQLWNVVIVADEIHTSLYVRKTLQRVFGYPRDMADRFVLEIGIRGQLAVWSGPYDLATNYVAQLQHQALVVELEKAAKHEDAAPLPSKKAQEPADPQAGS